MSNTRKLFAQLGVALACSAAVAGQQRDADAVLRDMRAALGGDAALDAVKTWSVGGSVATSFASTTKNMSLELTAMLPDHFLEVRRDNSSPPGPIRMDIDVTYYRGFRGDTLIRRVDSNIPFPPDPGPQTAAAIADREQKALNGNKRDFARLAVAMFGKSFAGSPLTFSYVGPDTADGQAAEVLEMRTADDFVMRLYVNSTTHLPALIAWRAPPPVVLTTTSTSTVAVRGGQPISQTPQVFEPPGAAPPTPAGEVIWRTAFSDFKVQDGLNWPHRVKEFVGDKVREDIRLGKFKLNPKVDARKFNVGR